MKSVKVKFDKDGNLRTTICLEIKLPSASYPFVSKEILTSPKTPKSDCNNLNKGSKGNIPSMKQIQHNKIILNDCEPLDQICELDDDVLIHLLNFLSECDRRKFSVCCKQFYQIFKYYQYKNPVSWQVKKDDSSYPWNVEQPLKFMFTHLRACTLSSKCFRITGKHPYLICELLINNKVVKKLNISFDKEFVFLETSVIKVVKMVNCENYLSKRIDSFSFADGHF